MKILIYSILTVMAFGAVANAQALRCNEPTQRPDAAYSVAVSSDRTRATVTEETIAGPQTLATLVCKAPAKPQPTCCDVIAVILTCSEPNMADDGYSVVVTSGGMAQRVTAVLSKETIAGAKQVASLLCDSPGRK